MRFQSVNRETVRIVEAPLSRAVCDDLPSAENATAESSVPPFE